MMFPREPGGVQTTTGGWTRLPPFDSLVPVVKTRETPYHVVHSCFMRLDSTPQTQSKAEWLLGYTHAQMSYHKALEVLGVSEAVVEEERARRLGELGLASWGGMSFASNSIAGQDGDDLCGGFFTKRRRSASHDAASLGTTLPGEIAFGQAHVRSQLKEGQQWYYY